MVDKLTTYRDQAAMAIKGPQGEMEVKATMIVALPDKIRLEYALPMGAIAMVVTPAGAFMQTPQGQQPMPARERTRVEKDAKRMPLLLLRHRGEAGFSVAAAGPGTVGDVAVEKLAIEFGGEKYAWSVDPATGRVLGQTYRGEGPTGAPGEIVESYSDFRPSDGATLPFKMITTFNGEPGASVTVTAIELNRPVDASLFEAPKAPAAKP